MTLCITQRWQSDETQPVRPAYAIRQEHSKPDCRSAAMSKKIYLAGPEVFLENGRAQLQRKADLARAYGFEPVCPGDLEIPPADTPHAFGLAISRVDEQMMNEADGVIANLTPFRGIAADVGTAFELGYMCAQGKLVAAYTNVPASHYERTVAYYGGDIRDGGDGHMRGPDGLSLENFDMIDNLMLDGGIERRGGVVIRHSAAEDGLYLDLTGFEACLKALAAQVKALDDARDEGRRPEDLDASNDG
jgi:nucleoside 2-deoxyribosyltransferase